MVAKIRGLLREIVKDITTVASIPVLVVVVLAVALWQYVDPAPPDRLVITTGADEGAYHTIAQQYQAILARHGVKLELRPSDGAVENLKRLMDEDSDVDIGFVQSGLVNDEEEAPGLESLGSLYYEPVWIFYRAAHELKHLSELKGRRIAIGREGGGTRRLSLRLLAESGIAARNAELRTLGGDAAADALVRGDVDVAIFLLPSDSPIVQRLAAARGVRLMNIDQAEALTRKLPYLHHLVLPQGMIDLEKNLPSRDVHILALTATLVVREDLHPALAYLLLRTARQVHEEPGELWKKHEFPSDRDTDLPVSDAARRYYKSGSPYVYRVLPFWLASLAERLVVLIVPLIAVLLPLSRVLPAAYSWRVRRKVYRWYGEIEFLEAEIRNAKEAGPAMWRRILDRLDEIEARANAIRLPVSFANHRYVLREHIDLVRRAVRERLQNAGARTDGS